ncbi:MAG: class I SAM-dependent methyltransferase [Acidimicrobiales bacterium]
MADAPPSPPSADEPTWHRYSTSDARGGDASSVTYGAELPTETDLKLLGPVEAKRILDLGCGVGRNAVTLAQQGAKVIAVDPSTEVLAGARERAEAAEVRVELHQAALAELAFLRSDSIDAAISVMALATVDDLARVFRQVHRVLKPEAPLVLSVPHPAFAMLDPAGTDPLRVVRAYDDGAPRTWELGERDVVDFPRTFADLFTHLQRANFRVDQVIEPTAPASAGRSATFVDAMRTVPATLVLRARKQGN